MKTLSFILFLFWCLVSSFSASASAVKPKPGQTSTTCYFNLGPKNGQTENLMGRMKPALIGSACSDGEGSSGVSVKDQQDEEAEEAEEAEAAAKAAASAAAANPTNSNLPLSVTCQFNFGPKTGKVESFKDKIPPRPIGSHCTDGLGSTGINIQD